VCVVGSFVCVLNFLLQGCLWFSNPVIKRPVDETNTNVLPARCRLHKLTYDAPLLVDVHCEMAGMSVTLEKFSIGPVPIMLMSKNCNAAIMNNVVRQTHEEDREAGGYFIINGNERLIRMLIAPKANHAMAIERATLTKCGPGYTKYGCMMRSVRDDGSGSSLQLLYRSEGTVMCRMWINRRVRRRRHFCSLLFSFFFVLCCFFFV
jgi:DNA-directed RNA polymerase I subunit RPA2